MERLSTFDFGGLKSICEEYFWLLLYPEGILSAFDHVSECSRGMFAWDRLDAKNKLARALSGRF
ncbi:hypothetical protein CJF25_21670 [Photobacterium phosphoreum]|nr:hypothetical protein [Photobacterium phosphoreum]